MSGGGLPHPLTFALVMAAVLAGCAGPDVRVSERSDLRRAENVAVLAADPIPLQHDEPPAVLADADLVALVTEGADNIGVRFVPRPLAPVAGPHLVLRFENVAAFGVDQLCAGEPPSSGPWFQSPPRLVAVMCAAGEPLAYADGVAADASRAATERMVRATVAGLFPGRHDATGVTLGGGIGSGGNWGLGGGLSF